MLNLVANGPSGYNLTNSLRFRSSASAYLNRTFTTPTNANKFTDRRVEVSHPAQ